MNVVESSFDWDLVRAWECRNFFEVGRAEVED